MAAVPEGGGPIRYFGSRVFDRSGSHFALGDTLFARITPCTENGKVTQVAELNGSLVGFGSTEFIVLSPRASVADAEFVYQVVASQSVRRRAVARMLGSSGRQRVPTWFFAAELTLPAFDLGEQQKIGRVLRSIDEAIQSAQAVIEATEDLRTALAQELLTRGMPGWHSEWKHVPGVGTMPACWEVLPLRSLAYELRYGTSVRCTSEPVGIPVLRIPNVVSGALDTRDLKFGSLSTAEENRLRLSHGDLLIVRTNDNPDVCGESCVVEGLTGSWAYASYLIRARVKTDAVLPGFLRLYLSSPTGRDQLRGNIRTSAGNYNLSAIGLGSIAVPKPSIAEQQRILEAISMITSRATRENNVLLKLRELKAGFASSLLTGRVRSAGQPRRGDEAP